MAVNSTVVRATPAQVYAVLADGWTYGDWVTGSKRIRAVDPGWPAPGSRFHHTFGVGPLAIDDSTQVLEAEPDRRIVLQVRGRPVGVGRVTIALAPAAEGETEVVMEEHPVRGLAKAIDNPLLDALVKARNAESLRRLKNLAERPR